MTTMQKYYDLENVYTCDYWEIPEEGTEVWCTCWKRGQKIIPCGDNHHIYIGYTVYHCDEFMGILERNKAEGDNYGFEVKMHRRQQINGRWQEIF